MPTTRKRANSLKDSPESTTKKRGAAKNTSPTPNKKSKLEKDQKTIEETIDNAEDAVEEEEAIENQINEAENNGDDERVMELQAREEAVKKREQDIKKREDALAAREKALDKQNGDKNAFDDVKADEEDVKKPVKKEDKKAQYTGNDESAIEDTERKATVPSSIAEKGIIYFFFRSRVNVEDPQGVEDIARSYIVLRPLPLGAKIGEGPLEDSGDARLLALPKKVLPKSAKDRFLVFVEKPKASVKDLKEQLSSSEYATKTVGTSHTPAATPFAEGIYAITKTGRESHLAYHITAPEIGEVQKEFGLHENGSYVVSVKNPETPAPGNAGLPNPAKYSEEVQKKFRGLRWMPLEPEFLDYENSQVLIIGAGMGEMGKALEEQSKDARENERDKPEEEIIKLEEEDEQRVEHLKEDDPVFADLGLSSKEYEKMKTKW